MSNLKAQEFYQLYRKKTIELGYSPIGRKRFTDIIKILKLIPETINYIQAKNEWLLIENIEPVENTRIVYEGNSRGIKATYLGKNKDGVGVVLLDNGHRDIFDRWKILNK